MAFTPRRLMRGASGAGGYQISRSLRFNSPDSVYLSRTPASTTNRRTWTWSGWIKRSSLVKTNELVLFACRPSAYTIFSIRHSSTANPDTILLEDNNGTNLRTTQVFRDVSAWYHIVLAVDTTQATDTNRVKLYVNGSQVTAFSATTYPTQNVDLQINTTNSHGVGGYSYSASESYDGYMTEVNFVDGTQLTPSSFGETSATTGVWGPKKYSGSYGTNGFYLNFSDNSNTTAATLGKDSSGNGNNWTPNNFSVTAGAGNDSLVDSPTSYGTDTGAGGTVRGNYATLNPLQLDSSATTLTNGNLDYNRAILGGSPGAAFSTIGMTSGKWYAEFTLNTSNFLFGVWGNGTAGLPQTGYPSYYWDFGAQTGSLSLEKSSGTSSGSGGTVSAGNVYAIAVDIDNATISFYQNNTLAYSVTGMSFTGPLFFAVCVWTNSVSTGPNSLNFGQRPFAYTAPSGFKALCTQNLPTPTIGATTATQAGKYFNPVLYTGTGATRTVTGVNFAPDLVWIKSRSAAYNNRLYDRLRGVENVLQSNSAAAEGSDGGGLTAFGSDGFTLGSSVSQNESASTFVAWNWRASNAAAATNTSGSISSQVSASTTSGFSIVTYTGQSAAGTVGHGLGVAPSMIIVKSRSNGAYGWAVWHSSFTQNEYLLLEITDAKGTASNYWNTSAPSTWTSAFGIGSQPKYVNNSGDTFVAYCFAEVAGYSKFGSYTGNGSTDGPFVYTGFRPAWIMIKTSSVASQEWYILDSARDTYNLTANKLFPNTSGVENASPNSSSTNALDFLSNGFKLKTTNDGTNQSAGTYVYMAFASNPFKYSLAR